MVVTVYVRPDGPQLRAVVELIDGDTVGIEPVPVFPAAAAAPEALAAALSGTGGRPVTLTFLNEDATPRAPAHLPNQTSHSRPCIASALCLDRSKPLLPRLSHAPARSREAS